MKIAKFLILFLMLGCSKINDLQSVSLDAAKILGKANNYVKILSSENIKNEETITATLVRFDKEKAQKYLNKKSSSLAQHYDEIKRIYVSQKANSVDALYVLAVINQITFFVTGNAIEDRCNYIEIIKQNGNNRVSEWVVEDFYGSIILKDHSTKSYWKKMNLEEKTQLVHDSMLAQVEGCIENKEKKTEQPH